MPPEKKKEDPMTLVYLLVGGLALLIAAWFASGGPERADLRGIFLAPPEPLGTGESYGPQVGEEAPWAPPNPDSN